MTRIRTLVHHTNPPALAGGCLVFAIPFATVYGQASIDHYCYSCSRYKYSVTAKKCGCGQPIRYHAEGSFRSI